MKKFIDFLYHWYHRDDYKNEKKSSSISTSDKVGIKYCKESSEKIKKLIIDLVINKPNEVSINIDSNYINIYSTFINKSSSRYLEIRIDKFSWTINTDCGGNSSRSEFLDKNLYNELVLELDDKILKYEKTRFNDSYDSIIKDAGLLRFNNLDSLV